MGAVPELNFHYECAECRKIFHPGEYLLRCPGCRGVLLIKQELASRADELRALFDGVVTDMWKYAPLLPIRSPEERRSMKEGGTPLLPSSSLARQVNVPGLYFKNEIMNPTCSFKDRQVAVGLLKAVEMSCPSVAVISSGNVAASASALSARHGLRCLVFVPVSAPEEKLYQAAICGAQVVKVASESSAAIMDLVEEACRAGGCMHLSTAGSVNPFTVEGSKTIAYEIFEQCGRSMPEAILVPVGGGGLLGGLWSGLSDLRELGLLSSLPRCIGVQAAGCAPLVMAMERGMGPAEIMATPWKNPRTVAGGIADDILFDAHRALAAIRESGGAAVAVTDEEIVEAMRLLAAGEGIFAEPSGAVALAGLMKLHRQDPAALPKSACCLVTGSGLKDMKSARLAAASFKVIKPLLKEVRRIVESDGA